MTPFLQSVAEYIYNNYKDNLQNITVVFPNKRARLFFNRFLGQLTDKPLFAPSYYTITEYMQKYSGTTLADQLTLLFELYKVFTDITKSKESFDEFLFYCEMMLADFDDLDKYLVNAHDLFQNLAEIKEIEAFFDYLEPQQKKAIEEFWGTINNGNNSEQKEQFLRLWNKLYEIYTEFNKRLNEQGLAYDGMAYRKAAETIAADDFTVSEKKVAFVGFNALNKCEVQLFSALKKTNQGLFFWDYDKHYLQQKQHHEAAYFLKTFVKKYPAPNDFTFSSELIQKDRIINIYDVATTTGQAKSLPLIIENFSSDWQSDPIKSAIALADESLLMPTLNALPEEIKEVNISMGYPLKETKIYGLTCLLLELYKNKRPGKKQESEFYYSDVVQVLQNGLFSEQGDTVAEFINEITRQNLIYINTSTLLNTLTDIFKDLFVDNLTPGDYIEYLKTILRQIPKLLSRENKNSYLIEREAALRILSQLNRIGDILKNTSIVFNFSSLTRLLAKLLEGATIPFTGEPLLGIQVMGILETRNIDFDNLIILSMNEGVFPKSGHVPSFVPYSLRKGFGMPTVEHQDAIFAYYFYRLLHRAKNVTLLYSSSVNDMKSGEASRFIHQLNYDDNFTVKKETLSYSINPIKEREVFIPKNKETLSTLLKTYTTDKERLLSPSAINTYLNCNTRFYYRYIAGIKEPEEVLEEIEANTLGSILHTTLENLYKPYLNEIISEEIIQIIINNKAAIYQTLLDAFVNEYISPNSKTMNSKLELHGKNKLVREVIYKYVISVLEHDKSIAPLTILGLEKKCKKEFTTQNGYTISVGGIIDRIDEVDGKTRIIDYKTGIQKNKFSSIEELFLGKSTNRNNAVFQTFLYALVLSDEMKNDTISPEIYFIRNIQSKNYSSKILKSENRKSYPIDSIKEVKPEFEELLLETLNDIFSDSGTFKQTEDLDYCKHCPYTGICGR